MNKWGSFLKRMVRVILWVTFGLVLLFILVALLIRIPSVQNKLVDYATTFVSRKTHTKVEIKNVGISFPKAVVLEGIYLEDTQTDTLLYAGKVKVDMALYGLLSSKIDIGSFTIEDATIRLYSTQTDPMFNYHFLISAFGDTTKQMVEKTASPSKWTFSLEKINLKNVKFTYNDVYGGMKVFAGITKANTRVGEIAPQKSIYAFNELILSGLTVAVQTSEPEYTQTKSPEKNLPLISAKKLQISNSLVNYRDSVNYLSVVSDIDQLELADAFDRHTKRTAGF
jgi:translocation and assembly module TamB